MADSFESKMRDILKTTEVVKTPSCLEDETIGLYIEGKLPGADKEKAENHISACPFCMNQLLELRELIYYHAHPAPISPRLLEKIEGLRAKEKKPAQTGARGFLDGFIREIQNLAGYPARRWRYAAVAFATACIALFIIVFAVWKPSEKPVVVAKKPDLRTETPSSKDIVTIFDAKADIKSLSASIKLDQGTVYGFSGGVSPEKASFRMGVYLTDLQVTSRAGDKEKSADITKKILPLLQTFSETAEPTMTPDQISERVEKGGYLQKNTDLLLYLRFGEWVEGGRLASIARTKEFFKPETIKYFIKNLERKDAGLGILTGLKKVEEIVQRKDFSDRDFSQLEKVFDDILGMM